MSVRPEYTFCCRMCGKPVVKGHVRIVLVDERHPRCRVFNGWVCDWCFDMLEAWRDANGVSIWEIGTPVLLTGVPDSLSSPTLEGVGGGGVGDSTNRESKTTPRTRTRSRSAA